MGFHGNVKAPFVRRSRGRCTEASFGSLLTKGHFCIMHAFSKAELMASNNINEVYWLLAE